MRLKRDPSLQRVRALSRLLIKIMKERNAYVSSWEKNDLYVSWREHIGMMCDVSNTFLGMNHVSCIFNSGSIAIIKFNALAKVVISSAYREKKMLKINHKKRY